MSTGGVLWSLVVTALTGAGSLAAPSELVIDSIPDFELTSGPAVDLDYDGYAALEPGSVAHLDPTSEQAVGMVAAIEIWTDTTADEIIVIELVRAIDEQSATTFVDQAAANAIAIGLAAADPPFVGAWSYSGGFEDTWTNKVAWNQGPFAVTMTQLSLNETDRDTIDAAALRQVELIFDATGLEVSDAAAVVDDAPAPPTDAPEPTAAPADGDSGRLPTVVMLVAALAVVVVAFVIARRRRAGTD
jgi:hypothetical protein